MSLSSFRRKIVIFLLGTALMASAAGAADLRNPAFPRPLQFLNQGTPGLLERVAALLGIFREKEGGSIDPYGGAKNGGSADPYGVPSNGQSTSEAGGSADPYGGR